MDNYENKKNSIKVVTIVLVLIVLGLAGWIIYDKYFAGNNGENTGDNYLNNNTLEAYYQKKEVYLSKKSNSNIPTYVNLNFEGTEYERITKKELSNRLQKYLHTCGFDGLSGYENIDCVEDVADYIVFINDGTPYLAHKALNCENDECQELEDYFDVVKYNFINKVKSVVVGYNQYNSRFAFAFQLENGDVYYFVPLDVAKYIDGKEMVAHLVKVELSSKLIKFSNIDNGQITQGTDIVLELENNEKYVLEYNQETNKLSLVKFADYYKKNHEFDNSVELSEEEEVIKVSSNVLKSEKLNNVINNNKFISDNLNEQEYNGICPEITINDDGQVLHFHVLQISETKVFLYADNDGSDGRMIEVYGLGEDDLYYARFFAIDYEDPENHSLVLRKYDIENVESIALVTIKDKSNMLTNDEEPETPENYAIFKTTDGKYYTDYSLDNDYNPILRQVVQK